MWGEKMSFTRSGGKELVCVVQIMTRVGGGASRHGGDKDESEGRS